MKEESNGQLGFLDTVLKSNNGGAEEAYAY